MILKNQLDIPRKTVLTNILHYSRILNILLETMNGVLHYMLLTTLSVELLIGNIGNIFTVLVNVMHWLKRRKISLIDQILTTLAISRISLLFSITAGLFVSEQYPDIIITRIIMRQICIFWTVTNHFSIWLATCLSIFYFLKIANFSNSIFLHLKWRVKKMISGTLLASLFFLFLNILVINTHFDLWMDRIEVNTFFRVIISNYSQVPGHIIHTNTMFTLIPFTVTLTVFLLLIFSLWRHLKNMQYNAKGSRDVSKAAHIKALQMVVSFLLLYSFYFLSLLLQFCNIKNKQKSSVSLLFWAIGVAFPSIHSCVLILGNTKLRQTFISVVWWLRCRISDVEPSVS
ncbi:taste receptor type 2 member 140-like [Arvicola amphibius]|uniref:taste receptor type 2 member 140-like n=1 Tax=Arvicola amphibius TaxID=1047088 RepID=UPI001C097D82|nr:taste receptor type 2 member 140-like [Arvicola amphibius]